MTDYQVLIINGFLKSYTMLQYVMLNLFQQLIKPVGYKPLKEVQGDSLKSCYESTGCDYNLKIDCIGSGTYFA